LSGPAHVRRSDYWLRRRNLWPIQGASQLTPRGDRQLSEHLTQVVLDRAGADEQLHRDLGVAVAGRSEIGDVRLLWPEISRGVDVSSSGVFTGRGVVGHARVWRRPSIPSLVEELIECVTIHADRLEVAAFGMVPVTIAPGEVGLHDPGTDLSRRASPPNVSGRKVS